MKTILVFPFNVQAHYLRCLVLADKFDKKEYTILFVESPQYSQYAEDCGYKTFPCKHFDADHVMACAKDFDFSWLNRSDLESIMLAQVAAIRKYKADMVIGDMSPSLKMAAEITSVKLVSLINGYMSKYYMLTRGVSRSMFGYSLMKKLPEPLSDRITDFAESIAFRYVHLPFRHIRQKYGLKSVKDYLSELEGDENIICDYEHLFPQQSLPAHYQVSGPLIYHPQSSEELWLTDLEENKPVIVVCMGSTGDWQKISFLNDPHYSQYLIIAAGDKKKVLAAPHIISKDFVNLSKVLQRADLMICHGGNGTMYNGIVNGVYMLCIPNNFEQEWNISAMERNGYGKAADCFKDSEWKNHIGTFAS